MEPLPYYKWHWQRYRANRRVQRMCWQARGLYREMLDEYWAEGSLPLDHAELAEICGCTIEEFETYWPQIQGCWEETQDGLTNATMDSMRTEMDSKRVTNAKNGKAGAIAKLANAKTIVANAGERQIVASERHIEEKRREEKSKEVQVPLASTAVAVPAGKLVCTLPLNQGDHEVFDADVQQWVALYPAVDVRQELRNLKGWLLGNPKLRKTKTGIGRFINSWLSRAQNEARPTGGGNGNRHGKTGGNLTALEEAERFARERYQEASDDSGGEETGTGKCINAADVLAGSGQLLTAGH